MRALLLLSLAWTLGAALEHAHECGIVHRGLEPREIIVLPDGRVKVMDFGVVRGGGADAPFYSAPEQESEGCSKASDLYALGACVYEMLTGLKPFPGPAFRTPSQAVPGLSPKLDGFMRRALDPEPGSRFSSAAEFAEAFEAL